MKMWSKSILSIYRYLPTLSNAIDGLVKKNSKLSAGTGYSSTYTQAGKLIEWTDKKRKMINLKVATKEALKQLPSIDRRILVLFYIDGVKSTLIADMLGCSIRTYYRKKVDAIERFGIALARVGFDIDYLNANYLDEKWLMSVYDRCIIQDSVRSETTICKEDKSMVKDIIRDLGKIKCYRFSTYI